MIASITGMVRAVAATIEHAAIPAPVVEGWKSAEDISFQRDRADIQPKCAPKIARLATWVNRHPLMVVALDGHSDQSSVATGEVNAALHGRRVQSVRDALIAAGVAPHRILTGAVGERRPRCSQATAACQELNRRVEVLLGTPRVTAAER